MKQVEYWDAYNQLGQKIEGLKLERGKTIPAGYYHLVVEIVVLVQKNVLLIQRAKTKAIYPNHFEATAGGSALLGETSVEAVKRELQEETGITIHQPVFINQKVDRQSQSLVDRYYVHLTDFPNVQLDKTETSAYQWVSYDQLETFLQEQSVVPRQKERLRAFSKFGSIFDLFKTYHV